MTTSTADRSSWISSIAYRRTPNGERYLAVFVAPKHFPTCGGHSIPVAMLYGPAIPSWLPGLICAGNPKRDAGRSIGRAYNLLLKGKHPYQRVEGREAVNELRRMMAEGERSSR